VFSFKFIDKFINFKGENPKTIDHLTDMQISSNICPKCTRIRLKAALCCCKKPGEASNDSGPNSLTALWGPTSKEERDKYRERKGSYRAPKIYAPRALNTLASPLYPCKVYNITFFKPVHDLF